MKYKSKSEAVQFADHLKVLIRNGHYSGFLPSVRKLASDNCVSSVTVHGAFRILVEQGVLIASGGTRRPRIGSLEGAFVPSQGSLLVVNGAKLHKLPVSVMTSLAAIEKSAPSLGFGFHRLDIPDGSPASLQHLRAELRIRKPSHLLFIHPHPAFLASRPRRGTNCAVLSAAPLGARKVFHVEVPHLAVPTLAFHKSKAAGHRHIALVDNVFNEVRRKALLRESVRLGIRLTIVRGGSLGADNWIHHPSKIRKVCAAIKGSGATCVLFPQWKDFMAAASGLEKEGLVVPERLSVVVAYRNGSSDHHHGRRISGCDIPADLAERIIVHWLEGGAGDAEYFSDLVLGTWDDGETLRAVSR